MPLVLTHTGNKAREWFISPTSSVTKFRLCCIKHSINIDWASVSALTKLWKQAENRIDPSGRRKRTLISVLSHTSNSNKLLFQNSIQMSTFYIFLVRSAPWPRKISYFLLLLYFRKEINILLIWRGGVDANDSQKQVCAWVSHTHFLKCKYWQKWVCGGVTHPFP